MGDSFGAFDPQSEDIDAYLDRFTSFLTTKNVVTPPPLAAGAEAQQVAAHNQAVAAAEVSRKAWLLPAIGPLAYQTLRDLCLPDTPNAKTSQDLITLLTGHFAPARNKHRQRDLFSKRRQHPNESLADYAVALRSLSRYCEFNAFLDEALQSQFINNLRSVTIKDKIIDGAVNFNGLVQSACRYEEELKVTNAVQDQAVNYVFKKHQSTQKQKQRIPPKQKRPEQSSKTPPGKAQQQEEEESGQPRCFNCNGYGHYSRYCKQKKRISRKQRVNQVAAEGSTDPDPHSFDLCKVDQGRNVSQQEGVHVTVIIEGVPVVMQLDTGARHSLIGRPLFERHFSRPLYPIDPLFSCTGHELQLLGMMDVEVRYGDQVAVLPLAVVDGNFPALFGHPWTMHLQLPYQELFPVVKSSDVCVVQHINYVSVLKSKYPSVFSKSPGKIKGIEVSLRLKKDAVPVFYSPRAVPIPLRESTFTALKKMEAAGYIQKCPPGQWGTPIVIVPKAGGEVRVCGDFSVTVNPQLEGKTAMLPVIDDLSTVDGSWFCSLDLDQAFLQLALDKGSRDILTLSTPWGCYRALSLLFGVSSAPDDFQDALVRILTGIPNLFVYLDNVLIWGKSEDGCKKILEKVLQRFQQYNVRLNLDKSEFMVRSVKYLGYVLDEHGLHPDPVKLDALKHAKVPSNVAELKTFTDFVNFYGKFAEHLSTILRPLYELQTSSQWKWGSVEQEAYDTTLREIGNKALIPYSLQLPLRLTCDASPVGAGAVISLITEDGQERPIAFASKTFSSAELNYPQHEREAAVLIFGVKKFHKYLYGRVFEIVSDNKALVAIFGSRVRQRPAAADRLLRWGLFLSAYKFNICHKKGELIPHADFLSRLPVSDATPIENSVNTVSCIDSSLLSVQQVATETQQDPDLRQVLWFIQHGSPDDCDSHLAPYRRKHLELSAENGCVVWGSRVVIPSVLRPQVLKLLHELHPGINRMKALARSYIWYPSIDQDIENCGRLWCLSGTS